MGKDKKSSNLSSVSQLAASDGTVGFCLFKTESEKL